MATTNFGPACLMLGAAGVLLFLLGGRNASPFPPGDGVARGPGLGDPVSEAPRMPPARQPAVPTDEVGAEGPSEEEETSQEPVAESPLPSPSAGRAGLLVHVEVPAGESVEGVRIEATVVADGGGEESTTVAEAGSDGVAWIEVAPERDLLLVAAKEGLLAGWYPRRSPAAGAAARVSIRLESGRALSGVVLEDGTGSPVPGARVLTFPDTFPFG